MKSIKFKTILVLLIILFGSTVLGQNKTKADLNLKEKDSSYISAQINFISDAVFMGRKDSISTPYLYPSITYHHKTGFYINGSFSYLTKSNESRIDLSLITLGFDFNIKKLDGDLSVTKYFFNTDSYNVISEVESDITASLRYDFDVVNLAVMANTYFNSDGSSDFFLSSEISHDFVTNNNKFQISPTAGIYLGSQNFYEQYYIYNRFGNGDRQGKGSGQGTRDSTNQTTIVTDVVLQESEKFNIMAIEFSVPIWYVNKPFVISFLPAFVVPKTPATLTVDNIMFEEDLESTFYWVVGFSYKF
ncbi:hypothetical protein [Yeosuana sp.]|uniref:hypothetical protein n=1 Tax=Yeosuana sp. TaxID=2529388 RepID=UPI0040551AFE